MDLRGQGSAEIVASWTAPRTPCALALPGSGLTKLCVGPTTNKRVVRGTECLRKSEVAPKAGAVRRWGETTTLFVYYRPTRRRAGLPSHNTGAHNREWTDQGEQMKFPKYG